MLQRGERKKNLQTPSMACLPWRLAHTGKVRYHFLARPRHQTTCTRIHGCLAYLLKAVFFARLSSLLPCVAPCTPNPFRCGPLFFLKPKPNQTKRTNRPFARLPACPPIAPHELVRRGAQVVPRKVPVAADAGEARRPARAVPAAARGGRLCVVSSAKPPCVRAGCSSSCHR